MAAANISEADPLISNAIASTNTAYANSGVTSRVRLVGAMETAYDGLEPDREPGVVEEIQRHFAAPVDFHAPREIGDLQLVQRDGDLPGADHPGPAGGGSGFADEGLPKEDPGVQRGGWCEERRKII